jgi:hypothetical protein
MRATVASWSNFKYSFLTLWVSFVHQKAKAILNVAPERAF